MQDSAYCVGVSDQHLMCQINQDFFVKDQTCMLLETLHKSLACIEFWHKFLLNVKFVFVHPRCYNLYMIRSQMFQKAESGGGSIFKVVFKS